MTTLDLVDGVHRLVKEALDRGTVGSLAEGEALLKRYQLAIAVGAAESANWTDQVAILTAVALARRVFLGGVFVVMNSDAQLVVPLPLGRTLREAVTQLGGQVSEQVTAPDVPRIVISGTSRERTARFEVRPLARGWCGGIVPIDSPECGGPYAMPLAAMLAAGFAISEAFLHVRDENASAGHRAIGLSLWNPHPEADWLRGDDYGPRLLFLPSRLWLLGLGHLGQAFLWALGILPYAAPNDLELVLQDVDVVTPSTESTSILSDATLVGQMKTRAMATWAERRGFSTRIHERLFGAGSRRREDEPPILLCGLDNALGRRGLDEAGFDLVVEAGLGRGYQDFRTLRLHTLPASRTAVEIWPSIVEPEPTKAAPAYEKLVDGGVLDRCGMTLLAGKAVGAPFVGAVAASLAISEILRLLHGGAPMQLIDVDLQWPEHREVVHQKRDFSRVNPGFVMADQDL